MRLAFNPYVYVRVAVMRALLFTDQEYRRMLKMSLEEIIEALRQSCYKAEIEERALRYRGAALVEHALNANLKRTYQKLLRIADDPLRELIRAYLFRNDVSNLKVILRAKVTKLPEEEIRELLLPGTIPEVISLVKTEGTMAVLKESRLFPKPFLDRVSSIKDDLVRVENELDREYFRRMDAFSSRIQHGQVIRDFVRNELETINISIIVKLKQLGLGKEKIEEFIIPGGLDNRLLGRLAATKDVAELVRRLQGTPYAHVLAPYEQEGVVYLEAALQRHLLKRAVALMHRNLLTVDVILAFMLSKEIEVLNVRRIVKAKQLGIPNSTVEKVIVM